MDIHSEIKALKNQSHQFFTWKLTAPASSPCLEKCFLEESIYRICLYIDIYIVCIWSIIYLFFQIYTNIYKKYTYFEPNSLGGKLFNLGGCATCNLPAFCCFHPAGTPCWNSGKSRGPDLLPNTWCRCPRSWAFELRQRLRFPFFKVNLGPCGDGKFFLGTSALSQEDLVNRAASRHHFTGFLGAKCEGFLDPPGFEAAPKGMRKGKRPLSNAGTLHAKESAALFHLMDNGDGEAENARCRKCLGRSSSWCLVGGLGPRFFPPVILA